MTDAGYSGKPLAAKLGIKAGYRLALLAAPADFLAALGSMPEGVVVGRGRAGATDIVMLFVDRSTALRTRLPKAKRLLTPNGAIWACWPKRASGRTTDLTEDLVRTYALAAGLVDVKVCAVDQVWSGLKLVYRLKDRPRVRAAVP